MSYRLGHVVACGVGLAASAALALGVVTAAPATAAQVTPGTASTPDPGGHEKTPEQELKEFQAEHGLKPTGVANPATQRALHRASSDELRRLYPSAASLSGQEFANARTVIGVGKGHNIPKRGQVIALMTAMQESKFINYTTPVDHDSLGIFQQRPSTGWGTPAQITNVVLSTQSFYGVASFGHNRGLLQIPNWQNRPRGEVAQAVQVSAFPDAYDQWTQWAIDFWNQQAPSVAPITGDTGGDDGGGGPRCSAGGPTATDYDGDTYSTSYCNNGAGYTFAQDKRRSGALAGGHNWFVCQKRFPNWENPAVGGARNNIWLYTQGDDTVDTAEYQGWGWFPATKVAGGSNYGPIPGLPMCSSVF